MLASPLAYNIIRESGFLILPSKRTLIDYGHWYNPKSGYQVESFQQLMDDAKTDTLNEAQR
jgi:hypothetical protein